MARWEEGQRETVHELDEDEVAYERGKDLDCEVGMAIHPSSTARDGACTPCGGLSEASRGSQEPSVKKAVHSERLQRRRDLLQLLQKVSGTVD